jgi:hypothetical protein
VRASIAGKSATARVVVGEPGPQDYGIMDAQFTQGVQAADGSVPMVLQGHPAVLNLLIRARQPSTTPTQLVLRLFDAAGAMIRADTVTTGTYAGTPGYAAPSAQMLVPSGLLANAGEWQVVRDPRALVPDDSAGNDVFPRTGRAILITASVPPLAIRLVPIVLSVHGGATGDVSPGTLAEYLRTARSVHPLGPLTATIGTPLTTSAGFGTPPTGGDASFWQQVLAELDMARVADTTAPETHWYGVVQPPPGFTFTTFGGFGYIPVSGQSTGPGTRTAVGVQVGWFSRPTQARDLVAHELGHNFGRRHAPCGGPSGVDPGFPNPSGTIGVAGHDVYSWAEGLTSSAPVVSPQTGDVMGYCYPMWSSQYSYRGVLQFRQGTVTAAPVTTVLVVRGRIEPTTGISLEPAFVLEARPERPERAGSYRLEGLTQEGRVVFAYDFEPSELDHGPAFGHFAFAIPVTSGLTEALSAIRVRGPAGAAQIARPAVAPPPPAAATTPSRHADGLVSAGCPDGTRGILVRHGLTGSVLGTAAGGSMRVLVASGTPLIIACSDGIRTTSRGAVAP